MALKWVKTIEAEDTWWDLIETKKGEPFYGQGYILGYRNAGDRSLIAYDFALADDAGRLKDEPIPKTEIRTWQQLRKALVAKYLLLRNPTGWYD